MTKEDREVAKRKLKKIVAKEELDQLENRCSKSKGESYRLGCCGWWNSCSINSGNYERDGLEEVID